MDGLIFALYSLAMILFLGAIYHLLALKKPGFYPPKRVLKKRGVILLLGGLISMFVGFLLNLT